MTAPPANIPGQLTHEKTMDSLLLKSLTPKLYGEILHNLYPISERASTKQALQNELDTSASAYLNTRKLEKKIDIHLRNATNSYIFDEVTIRLYNEPPSIPRAAISGASIKDFHMEQDTDTTLIKAAGKNVFRTLRDNIYDIQSIFDLVDATEEEVIARAAYKRP